jgi:hypothetical protein
MKGGCDRRRRRLKGRGGRIPGDEGRQWRHDGLKQMDDWAWLEKKGGREGV